MDRNLKRYGAGTRIKNPYSRMFTVTVRSPNVIVIMDWTVEILLGNYGKHIRSQLLSFAYINETCLAVGMCT